MKKVCLLFIFCCAISCNRNSAEPSKAAIDATLDLEGKYVVTDMIWLDDPSMTFDLNGDSVPHVLFEELWSFKDKFVPRSEIYFDEFVDGSGLAYEGVCFVNLPLQRVKRLNGNGPIIGQNELYYWIFVFHGQVNQDGTVLWQSGNCDEDVSTFPMLTIVYEDAEMLKAEVGKLEAEFPYRVYLPATEEFLDGRVLVKMVRK